MIFMGGFHQFHSSFMVIAVNCIMSVYLVLVLFTIVFPGFSCCSFEVVGCVLVSVLRLVDLCLRIV